MANENRAAVIAAEWWAAELANLNKISSLRNSDYFDPTPVKITLFRKALIKLITLALVNNSEVILELRILPNSILTKAANTAGIIFPTSHSTRTMKVRSNGFWICGNNIPSYSKTF